MKDHSWRLIFPALIAVVALLFPVMKCGKQDDGKTVRLVETTATGEEADTSRETQTLEKADPADLPVVGLQRGDAGFEQALLSAIARSEPNIDSETGFLWDTHTQPKGYHSRFDYGARVRPTRETMRFASLLIAGPNEEHQTQGRQLLEKVIDLQDQNTESATFGLWPWYYEEPLADMAMPDYNWADFLGATLASLLHDYGNRLPPELLAKAQHSLDCCAQAIIKRDVKPKYTNIAMMGAVVTAAAGELLDRQDFLKYGRMRIERNLEHYRNTGNFTEYNSPNYTPVAIAELERMLYLVDDPACRLAAAELLTAVWQTVAEHYHVPTKQWAGPFSRTYSDLISPRLRNTILARTLALSPEELAALPVGEQPSVSFFVPQLACPESLRHHFVNTLQGEVTRRHLFNKSNAAPEIGTTRLTPNIALGSVSYHTFWAQTRGLIAYWVMPDSDEPAVLKHSFLHNGNDFAGGCARNRQTGGKVLSVFGWLRNQGSMHPTFDRPTDGVFFAESFEIAYQLRARGASARELSPNVYELSAGTVRAVLHVADDCIFDGQPVQWQLVRSDESKTDDVVKLVGVCYRGESKSFALDALGETRIAVGLELLQDDQQPSQEIVTLSDADAPKNRDVPYYGIHWKPITGTKRLLVPAQPTDR